VQESLLLLRPEVTGEFFIILDSAPPNDNPPRVCLEIADGLPPLDWKSYARSSSKQSSGARIHASIDVCPQRLDRIGAQDPPAISAYLGITPPALDTIDKPN